MRRKTRRIKMKDYINHNVVIQYQEDPGLLWQTVELSWDEFSAWRTSVGEHLTSIKLHVYSKSEKIAEQDLSLVTSINFECWASDELEEFLRLKCNHIPITIMPKELGRHRDTR